jgi:hypothetical protein
LIAIGSLLISFSTIAIADRPGREVTRNMEEYRSQYEASSTYKNSIFYLVDRELHYSENGDSVNASLCMQKIDPYYFIGLWHANERPDTMLSLYKLTASAKKEFIDNYLKALHEPKSATYNVFKRMIDEDAAIKNSFAEDDTAAGKKLVEKRWKIDQDHFQYLYNYVKQNGWPSLEDGGLYAVEIAVKDEVHREYYVEYALDSNAKAVINMNARRFMLDPFMPYYMRTINYALGANVYSSYVANIYNNEDMLDDKIMKNLEDFAKEKDRTLKGIYFLFGAPEEKDMEQWYARRDAQGRNVMERILKELKKVNPKIPRKYKPIYIPDFSKTLIMVCTYK